MHLRPLATRVVPPLAAAALLLGSATSLFAQTTTVDEKGTLIVQAVNPGSTTPVINFRFQLNRYPPSTTTVTLDTHASADVLACPAGATCTALAGALQFDVVPTSLVDSNGALVPPSQETDEADASSACLACPAEAISWTIVVPVDNPSQVPPAVDQLAAQLRQETAFLSSGAAGSLTLDQISQRISTILNQFQALVPNMVVKHAQFQAH
jgi:ferredoxin